MKKTMIMRAATVLTAAVCFGGICDFPARFALPAAAVTAQEIVASGECGKDGDNLTWTLDSKGTLTISGEGEMMDYDSDDLEAPWVMLANEVKTVKLSDRLIYIGAGAFSCCHSLTGIIIPSSVTRIGNYAFGDCINLTSISIPNSVTSIGDRAFYGTPWLESRIEKNPLVIENHILIDGTTCSGDVTIPESVTNIGGGAFSYCKNLTQIIIPDTVTSIGDYAFSNCESLIDIAISESVTSIGRFAFQRCIGLSEIIIPDSVTSIDDYAFYNCYRLNNIKLSNSLTRIGAMSFFECDNLNNVSIPESVTSIGGNAFGNCSGLIDISIPESVIEIGSLAFSNTPWLKAKREEDPLVIVNNTLIDGTTCTGEVTIPDNVTSISGDAFMSSTITRITIPESVISIGYTAFCNCANLNYITINNKKCSIYDDEKTICNKISFDKDVLLSTFYGTIYGYSGSTAEEYAKKYNKTFVSLDVKPNLIGDVNFDDCVSVDDAQMVLFAAVQISIGKDTGFTVAQNIAADVDGDGELTVTDAQLILNYYVQNTVLGAQKDWADLLQ